MTHYDRLVDRIVEEIYFFWKDGQNGFDWDESLAKEKSDEILKMVEEFQSKRAQSLGFWRASD